MINLILHNLFTLDSEGILDEINLNINMTLDSINEYNLHLNLFKISNDFTEFLNNFGNNNIKPIYDEFNEKLEKISDNQFINFEINSKNINNSYDFNIFVNYTNNTILHLEENYFDNMTEYLNYYYSNYEKNFEKENYKITENNNLYEEKIFERPLDDVIQQLLNSYKKTKIIIQTLEEYDNFDANIIKNKNKLNFAFKDTKKLIQDNNYEEEDKNKFIETLTYLNNLGLEYYNKVNESFYNIKYYLAQSIQNIDNEINKCVNISYETIINKYKTLSEEEEPFNVEFSKNEEEQNPIDEHFTVNNNETYFLHAQIKNMQHYANFKFGIEFEDNDYRKPRIVANIINKSKPKNMILDVFSFFGNCGKNGIIIDTNFKDVNYTMNLIYDLKSNKLNTNTITNFEKYEYNYEVYQLEDSDDIYCFVVSYINFCINLLRCENKKSISKEKITIDKKNLIE